MVTDKFQSKLKSAIAGTLLTILGWAASRLYQSDVVAPKQEQATISTQLAQHGERLAAVETEVRGVSSQVGRLQALLEKYLTEQQVRR